MVPGTGIGLSGTFLGTVLGVLLATNVSEVAAWVDTTFNTRLFDASFVNYLPSHLKWRDVTVIGGIASLHSFPAPLYPAWRARAGRPRAAGLPRRFARASRRSGRTSTGTW